MTNSWWGACSYSGGITNSILTACGSASYFSNQDSVILGSSEGIYQTVGAGGYYLAANSPYVNAGTTNIDPVLLADLQTKTTFPPVVLTTNVWWTTNITLFPQAQRDTDTPDLGWHYSPLDFALYIAVSNATITVLPGTALGLYGSEYGVWLWTNGVFNCNGTATSPNYIVQYNTVQEQSNTNWETAGWQASFLTPEWADNSSANFAFTEWSVLTTNIGQFSGENLPSTPIGFQNCQFYSGTFDADGPSVFATNCLFRRVGGAIWDRSVGNVAATFCNDLFLQGSLTIEHNNSGLYTFRDNLFDQTALTINTNRGGKDIDICSNNAYVTTNNGVLLPENNDVILTASPAYESGDLGEYYYPTNLTNLIHQGSEMAADAGLYWYTVTTNNAIEGANTVSIGFHYVACGANGLPLTTNGFEMPLYLMDANGNGVVDSGEVNWQVAGDLGLTVVITQPGNNSQIP